MDEIFLYAMAIFYVTAGIMHFVKPKLYISIIPPYISPTQIGKQFGRNDRSGIGIGAGF